MKKQILALLLVAVSLFSCGCSPSKHIKIGTAGVGGIYNEFGSSLSNLAKDKENIEIAVKTTTGSSANLRLISKGYIDIAIAQSDLINRAYEENSSHGKSGSNYYFYAIAGLFNEACHIVVRADSKIHTIEDLLNKTVSIGDKESGTEENAKQILSVYGLNENFVKEVNFDYSKSAKSLESGEIDAFFCTAGMNSTVIDELTKQCDIRLLSIDEGHISKLMSAYKYYSKLTIPAGTYKEQNEDISTVGIKSVLVASDRVDEKLVEEITTLIFENADDLQYTVSATLELDEQTAVDGISIPFHKGAYNYYKSKGIKVKTV